MILLFPPSAANDNDEPQGWYCVECTNEYFLLVVEHERTFIRCSSCHLDVTDVVRPDLASLEEIEQCQP